MAGAGNQIFTAGKLTFTATSSGTSSAIMINGTKSTTGGPTIIVHRASISLDSGGSLVVGSRTVEIPTVSPQPTASEGPAVQIKLEPALVVGAVLSLT